MRAGIQRMARKFIDIGANLTDPMFSGEYNGKVHHKPDLDIVTQRAFDAGLDKIMITGGNLEDSRKALALARSNERFFSTIGVHPTRANELEDDADKYIAEMCEIVDKNRDKIVAVGEFGLDYERLKFSSKDVQIKNFKAQFKLVDHAKLPLFLHCRGAASDLHSILKTNRDRFSTGVVHSFDGTYEEAKLFLDLDLYIGLNGCSLRTQENLDTISKLPLDRIMLETDAPWCSIKNTDASIGFVKTRAETVKHQKWVPEKMVKGRNEPANIVQVLEVVAHVQNIDLDTAADTIYNNTMKVFWKQC